MDARIIDDIRLAAHVTSNQAHSALAAVLAHLARKLPSPVFGQVKAAIDDAPSEPATRLSHDR